MREQNEKYCEREGLCPVCHAELIEKEDPRGEHFGTPYNERILVCPNNCDY